MATALPNVGKGSRYGDLKRRLLFLLGALVVFRIGAHIPVPGHRSRRAGRAVPEPAGRHPRHVQHVLGRRAVALHHLRARHHAVHLGLDHHAADDRGQPAARAAAQGRRDRAAQDHAVHALRHGVPRAVPGHRHLDRARVAARPGARPGPDVPHHHRHHAGHRHHVPDVARRADHRARPGQRHLDHHLRRHRRRPAERHRRHARAGAHRRHAPAHRAADRGRGAGGHRVRVLRRARPAQDPGELRQAPGRQPRLRRPELAPAVQAQHVGRDPADLRQLADPVPGHAARLVRLGRGLASGCATSPARSPRASRSTCCCTPR